MNPIRQRDEIKRIFQIKLLKQHLIHPMLQAPAFEYTDDHYAFTDQEVEYLKPLLFDSEQQGYKLPIYAPFPHFRVYNKEGWTHYHYNKEAGSWFVVESLRHEGQVVWTFTLFRKDQQVEFAVYINEKPFEGVNEAGADHYVLAVKRILVRFLAHILYPNSTVLQVKPKHVEARSVEWVLAHTHYTIINTRTAQRMAQSKRALSSHDLKRSAHWRRAHFRLLRAERFTHKRGQLRPVKESWIGPREWVGLDDKMYKVIDIAH